MVKNRKTFGTLYEISKRKLIFTRYVHDEQELCSNNLHKCRDKTILNKTNLNT